MYKLQILIISIVAQLAIAVLQEVQANQESIELCRLIESDVDRLKCYDALVDNKKENQKDEQSAQAKIQSSIPALLADLNEPRIYASYGRSSFLDDEFNSVLIGVGTRVKLKEIDVYNSNHTLDFNLLGLIKSQFDVSELDTRNNRGGALINTDFMVGGELVKSFTNGNLRLKYAHQSFHLGDEFLIDNPDFLENRINLSYETLGLLAHRKFNRLDAYAGADFIVRAEPGGLDKLQLQTGIQYRGLKQDWYTPLIALDLKSWGEIDWQINSSFKAGFEFSGYLDKPLQVMFEYYDGNSPYGQFINEDFEFIGLSINHHW